MITSRHYLLSERNKNGERTSGTNEEETIKMEETRKQPSKLEGPGGAKRGRSPGTPLGEVIGPIITVGALGFWFGIGAALGSKVVNNLEEQIIKWKKKIK